MKNLSREIDESEVRALEYYPSLCPNLTIDASGKPLSSICSGFSPNVPTNQSQAPRGVGILKNLLF